MEESAESNEFSLEKQSKYNSGLHQISRLSNLKDQAHIYAEKCDWNNYKRILDRIWIELAPESKKNKEVEEIKKEIHKVMGLKTGLNNEMNIGDYPEIRAKVNLKNALIKRVLEKYEILLRSIENKLGLGMSYRNESEEGIE